LEVIRFGQFELHRSSRELYKFGTKLKLRPQPFQVLKLLLEHPGEVVSRERLQQQLWPSDTFVDFEHSLNTAIKELRAVLDDSAVLPRYIQTLPKLGYRFVFPVEQHSSPVPPEAPDLRPESQLSISTPTPTQISPVVSPSRWASLPLVAAVLLILGIGLVVVRLGIFRRSASGAASASIKPRPSVAVLGFKNLSRKADDDWMSTAMAEILGAELASGQQIRIIPSENISRMKLDLALSPSDTFAQDTLAKIRDHLGTDMVASGSFLALRDGAKTKLRIVLQVQDTCTGETIAAITEDGSEADLPQLLSAGGDTLRNTLGIGSLSANAAREVRAVVPANSEAERLYAEGLVKLQRFDALGARALLEQATAADPNHALSHAALAESLSALGYDLNAQSEAKKALDLSTNLSREDRLSIEGRYRELTHDRAATLEIYRTLHTFFPDSLGYGLRFARSQVLAGNAADALGTIEALHKLPAPIGLDPRIDLAESFAADRAGGLQRSLKAAAVSIERAKTLGSGLALAAGLDSESWALLNLGEPDKAIADEIHARELWIAAGNSRGAAAALHGVAIFQRDKGDFPAARKAFEQALADFRRLGANRDIASCSHNLGMLLIDQGELDGAKSHLEEALRIQRAQNDKHGVAADLDDLSNVLLSIGQLSSAQKMKDEALQDFRDIGDKRGQAITLFNMGQLLYQGGDLAGAKDRYEQAKAIETEIAFKSGLGYSLLGIAEVLMAQDQLVAALDLVRQSQALRAQTKEEVFSAQSDLDLAKIALGQDKLAGAESRARKTVAVFVKHNAPGSAAQAYAALARSLVAQGKLADARAAADRSLFFAQQVTDHIVRLDAGLAAAQVDAQSGKLSNAERTLDSLRQQARHDGYTEFEFQARLLLGEAQLKSGNSASARASLDQLRSDARNKGFLLIVRKANASLPGAF